MEYAALFILILAVLFIQSMIATNMDIETTIDIQDICKPHDWSINPQLNVLQCIKCNKIAG
jgi:hypothetical protein